jgi:hypothetical protein
VGGLIGNTTRQGLDITTGNQTSYSYSSAATETALGAGFGAGGGYVGSKVVPGALSLLSSTAKGNIGEGLSLVDNMPSPETCTARGRVTAATLTPERFNALYLLAPAEAHQFEYMVAEQMARDLQEKNKSLRKGLAKQKSGSLLERLFGS